ncbi:MAG: tRNA pseudouridine(55) synthase TruB, partial [Candidatus Caldatribacteriaceae bacterium]
MEQKLPRAEVTSRRKMSGGILNIYKPVGFTSRQVVERIVTILGSKAGHAGTLDPFARGVLIVCWGKATRFSSLFQSLPKVYRAWIRFGISTDTYDVTGTIKEYSTGDLREEQLSQILQKYQGAIVQKVPVFSACKYKGRSLHYYARKGLAVPELTKQVEIHSLQLAGCQEGKFGAAELLVECSSGTYIRSLASELGNQLGLGAYLLALRRERVGKFLLEESLDVFDDSITAASLQKRSFSIDEGLYWIPSLTVNKEAAMQFKHGNILRNVPIESAGWYKVYWEDQFLGLGEGKKPFQLYPKIVLAE